MIIKNNIVNTIFKICSNFPVELPEDSDESFIVEYTANTIYNLIGNDAVSDLVRTNNDMFSNISRNVLTAQEASKCLYIIYKYLGNYANDVLFCLDENLKKD